MKESPYLVEPSEKPQEVLRLAISNGLFEFSNIDKNLVNNYLESKEDIPIWVIEAACNFNIKNINVPSNYQYLWFCLHNSILNRKQPSGREFKTKVNFSSCYLILDNKLKNLLRESCNFMNISLRKFAKLCGFKKVNWNNEDKIPLIAVLKICQILNIDINRLLIGRELISKNKREGKIIMPKINNVDLILLLIWLKTEGHLELHSTHIEINQKNNLNSLIAIKKLFIEVFKINKNSIIYAKGKKGEDRLIISSSPLRQYLSLIHNIPLGYKSGCLRSMNFNKFSNLERRRLLAAFVQTEGCLSRHNTGGKKKKLPRFEFEVKDIALAKDCFNILKSLGFNPKFYDKTPYFKIGLYNSKETIKLVNQIKPYVLNKNKINYLKEICTNGIRL